jgi:short-subunit dehydrogenase
MSGQHAIVFGGSSGIGLAIGRALRGRAWTVSSLSRRPAPEDGAERSFACDVTLDADVARATREALDAHGPCDLLVYASGVPVMGRTLEIPAAEARRCFEVNFWGMDRAVRALLPAMLERRRGSLLLVGSIAALRGIPNEAYYAASKAAATRYLECLAHEARRGDVRVHALQAGLVDTGFFERGGWHGMRAPDAKGSGVTPDDVAREALRLLDRGAPAAVVGRKERLIALGDRLSPALYDAWLRLRGG